MSRYQPVFPSSSPPPEGSLPSSVSSSSQPTIGYLEGLGKAHAKLAALPDILSSEPSLVSEPNVKFIQERLLAALKHANYNTRCAKWGHVTRTLKMACTSRRYVGVADGVVVGDEREVLSGDYEFVLPETEEEWEECERRWEKRSLRLPSDEGRTSKYFTNNGAPSGARLGELNPSKAEQVRDKVKQWQARVVPVLGERGRVPAVGSSSPGKGKDVEAKKQSPLPFPVAKAVAAASTSKPLAANDRTLKKSTPDARYSSEDGPQLNAPDAPVKDVNVDTLRVVDVSEMAYFPPSFPSQLPTSTPPRVLGGKPMREKPPPIPALSPFLVQPSSPPLPKTPLERIQAPLASSSSLPVIPSSPPQHPGKRIRPITPPTDNDIVSVLKRARMSPPAERVSSPPVPPSSTSPPVTRPGLSPHAISTGKGLGNAKGLPVPHTPHRPNIPTLTELLASSRRSKPRPRPPSRKSKSRATTPSGPQKDGLPALKAAPEREVSPAPSAPRTLLSSPASGSSSSSPMSMGYRPRSPVSPLFSRSVGAFAPPFASTQVGGAVNLHEPAILGKGSSGLIGMGYNSQFDVEGRVGMVSDLLERDVDFDGWLRDIPEVDPE